MKSVRTLIVVIALALMGIPFGAVPGVAQGQPSPESLQAAQKLLSLLSPSMVAQLTEQINGQTWPQMESALRIRYPNISAEALNAVRKEITTLQNGITTEILADAPAIYARYFTAEELRQLTAFYQTPTGAKYLQVASPIMTALFATVNPRLPALQQKTSGAVNAILRVYGSLK
jgi:hypothetical protein